MIARVSEVPPTRLRQFFCFGPVIGFFSELRRWSWVDRRTIFVGHQAIGYLRIGEDLCSMRRVAVAAGCGRQWDAREGEIAFRHWFRWAPDFPRLIYVNGDGDWDAYSAAAWTGRTFVARGYSWRGRHKFFGRSDG